VSEIRPRIIVLSDFGHVNGGAARVALASACGLAQRGWSVVFVCAVAPIAEELAAAGVDVRHVPITDVWRENSAMRAACRGIWNPFVGARLVEILAEKAPQRTIVHAQQWTRALSPAALAAAGTYGASLIVTLHDYFAACPNGLFFDFSIAQACPRTPLSPACLARNCDRNGRGHKAVRVARQIVTRHIWRRSGSLTFAHVSSFAKRRILQFLPAEARHVVVKNPCFVDRAPPVPVAANRPIVYIGRLTVEKGLRQLLAAVRGSGVPLLVQGDGPLRPEVEALGGSVRYRPWGDEASVLDTLQQARALVLPSVWEETGTMNAFEAFARGVPVIATRMTPAAALIEQTRGGLVVPTHDITELRKALCRLATDDEVASMGDRAYRGYWRAPCDLEHHLDSIERLYRWVADGVVGDYAAQTC
jgi:glycosyltransferase involved in cell wall biosynthesis